MKLFSNIAQKIRQKRTLQFALSYDPLFAESYLSGKAVYVTRQDGTRSYRGTLEQLNALTGDDAPRKGDELLW